MTTINDKTIENLKALLSEVLLSMGVSAEIWPKIVNLREGESVVFNLETDEAPILIGRSGVNLFALQHLIRVLYRKKFKEEVNFTIDVNKYRSNRENFLKNLAAKAADKVKKTGKDYIFPPMPSYERRIIHLFLADEKEVVTESRGIESERRLVVRPK